MGNSRYITPNSFNVSAMEDVMCFHELSKASPFDSMDDFLHANTYLNSTRGAQEASRNYKLFNTGEVERVTPLTDSPVAAVYALRRSCRSFDRSAPFDPGHVRAALAACAETRSGRSLADPETTLGARPYPSGGGLYPIEIHLLERGANCGEWDVKYFLARENSLRTVRSGLDQAQVSSALTIGDDGLLDAVQGAFLLSALWERSVVKYRHAGYRLALIETGIVTHHLTIVLTERDIASLNWNGFFDDRASRLIGADVNSESVVHVLWFGGAR